MKDGLSNETDTCKGLVVGVGMCGGPEKGSEAELQRLMGRVDEKKLDKWVRVTSFRS